MKKVMLKFHLSFRVLGTGGLYFILASIEVLLFAFNQQMYAIIFLMNELIGQLVRLAFEWFTPRMTQATKLFWRLSLLLSLMHQYAGKVWLLEGRRTLVLIFYKKVGFLCFDRHHTNTEAKTQPDQALPLQVLKLWMIIGKCLFSIITSIHLTWINKGRRSSSRRAKRAGWPKGLKGPVGPKGWKAP